MKVKLSITSESLPDWTVFRKYCIANGNRMTYRLRNIFSAINGLKMNISNANEMCDNQFGNGNKLIS